MNRVLFLVILPSCSLLKHPAEDLQVVEKAAEEIVQAETGVDIAPLLDTPSATGAAHD